MKKKILLVVGIIMCVCWGVTKSVTACPILADEMYNGHEYRVIKNSLPWQVANAQAQLSGWYLATITSPQEQAFIVSLIQSAQSYYQQQCGDNLKGLWLGGYLLNNNWTWVTGESWNYTNWGSEQPSGGSFLAISAKDNCGGGCCGNHCCASLSLGQWYTPTNCNCGCSCCCICGYIEEKSAPAPVPEPTTMFLLGAGILGIWGCRNKCHRNS